MKVLAIVPAIYDTSPGQRYRIEQWEPILKDLGLEITYEPFENENLNKIIYQSGHLAGKLKEVVKGLHRRYNIVRSVQQYDAVYLYREAALLGPPVFERMIKQAGVPIVFDFDDAIFIRYKSPTNGYLSYLKFPGKIKDICRMSSHVMTGNEYLADYAREVNENVTVIPTTIDTNKYRFREKSDTGDKIVIGWTGSHSTVKYLDTLRPVWQRLAKEENFRLRVIGTPHYEIEGVEVEAIKWQSATETEDLQPLDIGVMPLTDDIWTRGKCGMKALQYMALGIPAVCSPVGVNSDIIQDGENGLLAADTDEWVEKLKLLIRSTELRKKLGAEGRKTIEKTYSAKIQAPRVYQIFASLVGKSTVNRAAKNVGKGSLATTGTQIT